MARDRPRLVFSSGSDDGITVIEMLVVAAIGAIILTVFGASLITMLNLLNTQQDRTTSNDQTRLAVEHVDRHVRSAAALSSSDGYDLVAHTWSTPSGTETRCIQWTVASGQMRSRSWPANDPDPAPTPWRVVAEGLVNEELNVPVFHLTEWGPDSPRTVEVSVLANQRLQQRPEATTRLDVAVTARNASYGPAPSPVPPIPPLPDACVLPIEEAL